MTNAPEEFEAVPRAGQNPSLPPPSMDAGQQSCTVVGDMGSGGDRAAGEPAA
jgi:hypothetical protein